MYRRSIPSFQAICAFKPVPISIAKPSLLLFQSLLVTKHPAYDSLVHTHSPTCKPSMIKANALLCPSRQIHYMLPRYQNQPLLKDGESGISIKTMLGPRVDKIGSNVARIMTSPVSSSIEPARAAPSQRLWLTALLAGIVAGLVSGTLVSLQLREEVSDVPAPSEPIIVDVPVIPDSPEPSTLAITWSWIKTIWDYACFTAAVILAVIGVSAILAKLAFVALIVGVTLWVVYVK